MVKLRISMPILPTSGDATSLTSLANCGDVYGHLPIGEVFWNSRGVVTFLTDGGGGGSGLCEVRGCWHAVEGDEADKDDHQRDQRTIPQKRLKRSAVSRERFTAVALLSFTTMGIQLYRVYMHTA
ncbi:hypothetical protein EYF80_012052 [Liparis tanakae]|uniref:Uncharacterized protein n=1 Tax=Liparis tanakae TaxID=230148 RepID=A0A4Z2IJV7_9TELE|nr:hypothetical protein EYF80_012052 [Liparis tanakae]